MKVERALISVWDKTGLDEFVKGINQLGIEIISTGGTCERISSLGIPVTEVSSYTASPEMLDGRVKTLHPKIHAGLLALRDNASHMRKLEEGGAKPIDMVVVNLYPFEQAISRDNVTEEEAIENIDIGGPTMLRSAAKNFKFVAAVSSPQQYDSILNELEENGSQLKESTLKNLATEVFAKTSQYDGLITEYLSGARVKGQGSSEGFPEKINIELKKVRDLRYGENPHQQAAFYRDAATSNTGIVSAEHLQGKELSFNNILDLTSAFKIVKCFTKPVACIVKHNNPCGVATADTLEKAFLDALDCDRKSAFGGIIGFNKPITKHIAEVIIKESDFTECIIAPEYEKEALEIFKSKKNLRVLKTSFKGRTLPEGKDLRKIPGGALVQDWDTLEESSEAVKWVTEKKPQEKLLDSLLFGWKIARFVKSNAIVLCQGTQTVGIGAGQASRVDSVIIAIRKAGVRAKGAVLASDAFFPKSDSIDQASRAGITAIIQPGGSIRDEEVITACNRLGIAMAFTGTRHFRH